MGKFMYTALLVVVVLSVASSQVLASPANYFATLHPSVQRALNAIRQNNYEVFLDKVGDTTNCDFENMVAEDCCGIDIPEQRQWYTQNKALNCRVAGADFAYVYAPNASDPDTYVEAQAKTGDIMIGGMGGDSIFAPSLLQPSCYLGLGCEEGEFCLVDVQVPQNPWSQGPGGATPDPDTCGDPQYIERAQVSEEFNKTYQLFCGNMPPDPAFQYGIVDYAYNPAFDEPIRSKCVAYKKENEPCLPKLEYGEFGPMWPYRDDSLPYDVYSQGFVCAPGLKCSSDSAAVPNTCIPDSADESTWFDTEETVVRKEHESCDEDSEDPKYVCEDGLVCTSGDYYVLPNTCVQPRPKDICYYGSWWNSNACPKVENNEPGLNWTLAFGAMQRFMILFPSELTNSGQWSYWCPEQATETPYLKTQLEQSHDILYNILKALFPMELFPDETFPTKEELLLSVIGEEFYVITEDCSRNANDILESGTLEGEELASILARAAVYANEPNQIWSLIHFMTYNLPENISEKQVEASKALSTYLSQQFWCSDCRALYTKIIDVVTGPPDEATGDAQAQYWQLAHNLASEHVAATVGGFPLTYGINDQRIIPGEGQYSGQEVRSLQNHFYMLPEVAEAMWRVIPYDCDKEEDSEGRQNRRRAIRRAERRRARRGD